MSNKAPRREVRPDQIQMGVATDLKEIESDDPGYVYRYVGKDSMQKLHRRRQNGWKVAQDGYEMVRIGLPREEYEKRVEANERRSRERTFKRVNASPDAGDGDYGTVKDEQSVYVGPPTFDDKA